MKKGEEDTKSYKNQGTLQLFYVRSRDLQLDFGCHLVF